MGLITIENKQEARRFALDVLLRGNDDAYNRAAASVLSATEYATRQALDFGRELLIAADEDRAMNAVRMDPVIGAFRALGSLANDLADDFEKKREELFEYSKNSPAAVAARLEKGKK